MKVFGELKLAVSVDVEQNNEKLAELEAGYILHPELVVGAKLTLTNANGQENEVDVHEILDSEINDVIG